MESYDGRQEQSMQVKLSDLIEGMDFQSDERSSYLNRTTGEVVSITAEKYGLRRTTHLLQTSRTGNTT